jgi:phosphate transport system substrate-binding protein
VGKKSSRNFVKANLESVTAAAAGVAEAMPDDFRVSITDAPGEKAYPISSFTWLLVPAKFNDKSKLKVMKDFLQWMSTDGQKLTEQLQYAHYRRKSSLRTRRHLARSIEIIAGELASDGG